MPVSATSARRARFFSRCLLLPLLVLLLAASCRSAQSAYQFRSASAPVAHRPAVAEPATPPAATATAEVAEVAAPVTSPARPRPASRRLRHSLQPKQVRQQMRLALGQVRASSVRQFRAGHSAGQATRAAASPRKTTEVGLGTTVLGVLGLVVLPLALLGLLIWGGPVWAILAGLAALAVLVAYLDPFK